MSGFQPATFIHKENFLDRAGFLLGSGFLFLPAFFFYRIADQGHPAFLSLTVLFAIAILATLKTALGRAYTITLELSPTGFKLIRSNGKTSSVPWETIDCFRYGNSGRNQPIPVCWILKMSLG